MKKKTKLKRNQANCAWNGRDFTASGEVELIWKWAEM